MVHGDVKESLDLVGMEVAGHKAVGSGSLQEVCREFGPDGHARFVLAVLTCPAEIRNYGDDLVGRGPLGRIDGKEQFHQVVGRRECGLEDEARGSPHALDERGLELSVTESSNLAFTEVDFRIGRIPHAVHLFNHLQGEVPGGPARKQFHSVFVLHGNQVFTFLYYK